MYEFGLTRGLPVGDAVAIALAFDVLHNVGKQRINGERVIRDSVASEISVGFDRTCASISCCSSKSASLKGALPALTFCFAISIYAACTRKVFDRCENCAPY